MATYLDIYAATREAKGVVALVKSVLANTR